MDVERKISFRERIRLNLVSAMKRANISQVQLAEELGISKGTVNNWVRGNNSPDVDMVPKICNVLGIETTSLYYPAEIELVNGGLETKNFPSADESAPGDELDQNIIHLVRGLSTDQKSFLFAMILIIGAQNQGLPASDLASAVEAALKERNHSPH